MTTNEETKGTTQPVGASDDDNQILDIDDVEGHGMREVAAGLGAAAVLASGGTAAASALGVHPSAPHVKAPTPSISNPVDSVDRTTDWAIDSSRDLRDGAIGAATSVAGGAASLAGSQVSATSTAAGSAVAGTERAAGAVVDATGQAARDELKVAGSAVGATGATAINATRGTLAAANSVVSGTTTTVTNTTSGTVTDAARKTATVLKLTASTVNALETTIVVTVDNLNPQAGAGSSGMGSTGWVTFSLGGENIASVQLTNGQASVTVKTASLGGKVLQAVYSGDAIHASSMRSMTL
ncbi:MAG: hypothetical protein M3P04_11100 [Actinomycetota bacterium]|nr:hypothetical protein [Actinomycetota bacterium]